MIPLLTGWSLAAKIVGPIGVVVVLGGLVWGYGQRQYLAGKAVGEERVQAQWAAAKDRQRQVDAAERDRRERESKEVESEYTKRLARAKVGAVASRSELDRLRDAVASAEPPDCSAAASREPDAATAHDRVVLECAAELQAVAEHTDALQEQVRGLQAWVRRVPVGEK